MDISVKELNKLIEEFELEKEPQKLMIGYKTYSKLMKEDKFLEQLSKNLNDPMIRYYRGIEIRIITEKHFFCIE
ncbi:hypothetical protein QR665_17465 [Acinetobacter gerneri]|uniref:hypothetical protein n=1 Tax=Acinetobacter gerneri TaxID=202952 RepID=UPI002936A20F|nr:hypothetical protein [Acinetobacter gerneri]MDV2441235.1 hypothetical protein [Acinetobacter gerneri]